MDSKGLITHAAIFNRAAPGANTDILTTAITPKEGCAIKITALLATGSVLNMTVTDGTTTFTGGLNSSTSLNAGDWYTFTIGANPVETNSGDGNPLSYNFQVETDGIIQMLLIQESQIGTNG